MRTFEVKKVEFLRLIRFLKELQLKLHGNLFFYIFQDFAKMKQKIKKLVPTSVNKYFEVFRINFWAYLEKKYALCKSVKFTYKKAPNGQNSHFLPIWRLFVSKFHRFAQRIFFLQISPKINSEYFKVFINRCRNQFFDFLLHFCKILKNIKKQVTMQF